MKSTSILVCLVLLSFAALASAQAPQGPPKPAPELERLTYFSGTWTSEGDMKPSPWGPGGKFSPVKLTPNGCPANFSCSLTVPLAAPWDRGLKWP
jgi:hypothetical protein